MREQSVSIIAAAIALAACGKGGPRILKTSVVDRPREHQGEMKPQNWLLVDVECSPNARYEGRLLPAPEGFDTNAFRGDTDKDGRGQGALELSGSRFAKATQVEVRCDDKTATAPVSLPLTVLFTGSGALCWGTSCDVKIVSSRGSYVLQGEGPDLEGFTFAGQSSVADGDKHILRVAPPAGVAKLRLDQLDASIPMSGALAVRSHGKTAEVTIPPSYLSANTGPLAVEYVEKIESTLAGAAPAAAAPPARSSAVLRVDKRLYPIGDVATTLDKVEVLAIATEIRTGSKIRTINCGTYRGAGGASSSYVVYLIDSDVTVYDLPSKTILGTKKFRASGSCPTNFLSKNGEQGKSGGYASPDAIEAYVSTFVK